MKEKILLKIALVCSLGGILLLFFISDKLDINEKMISEIDEVEIGSEVKIQGVVSGVEKRGSMVIVDIAQLEKMNVIVFDNISLNQGDYVEINGRVEEYEGETQLIADKIILKQIIKIRSFKYSLI